MKNKLNEVRLAQLNWRKEVIDDCLMAACPSINVANKILQMLENENMYKDGIKNGSLKLYIK